MSYNSNRAAKIIRFSNLAARSLDLVLCHLNPVSIFSARFSNRLLHVHPLLGNMIKQFPGKQILGKQSVDKSRNHRSSCAFRVRGDVTIVDSDHVTCVYCWSMPVPRLIIIIVVAVEAREQSRLELGVQKSTGGRSVRI
jgi:hypothetical protein